MRKGSNAGTAPWFTSLKRWPTESQASARLSIPVPAMLGKNASRREREPPGVFLEGNTDRKMRVMKARGGRGRACPAHFHSKKNSRGSPPVSSRRAHLGLLHGVPGPHSASACLDRLRRFRLLPF